MEATWYVFVWQEGTHSLVGEDAKDSLDIEGLDLGSFTTNIHF